jgi:prevent-host-death family protein
MKVTNIHEAKTHFSKLVERAMRGEEVIIAKAGKPVVKLVKLRATKPAKQLGGFLRGKIWVSDDFDGPLPPDIQTAFDGEAD